MQVGKVTEKGHLVWAWGCEGLSRDNENQERVEQKKSSLCSRNLVTQRCREQRQWLPWAENGWNTHSKEESGYRWIWIGQPGQHPGSGETSLKFTQVYCPLIPITCWQWEAMTGLTWTYRDTKHEAKLHTDTINPEIQNSLCNACHTRVCWTHFGSEANSQLTMKSLECSQTRSSWPESWRRNVTMGIPSNKWLAFLCSLLRLMRHWHLRNLPHAWRLPTWKCPKFTPLSLFFIY